MPSQASGCFTRLFGPASSYDDLMAVEGASLFSLFSLLLIMEKTKKELLYLDNYH